MSDYDQPRFPAVLIYDHGMTVYEIADDLLCCRKSDLNARKGRFAPATIVDSDGVAWRLTGAEKVRAVGPFMGFNLFLNQSIRVRLTFDGMPTPINLDWLKGEVVTRLREKDAFGLVLSIGTTTIDSEPARMLIPQVEQASAAGQIIGALLAADFPERQRWELNPIR